MAASGGSNIEFSARKPSRTAVLVSRVLLIGMFASLIYLFPPRDHWAMWWAAGIWCLFSVYWSIAAKNSAEAKSAESSGSRRVHQALLNGGILLLFLPIPGLRQAFVPGSLAWILAGLFVEAASFGLAIWARRHLGGNWSGRIEIKTDHALVRTGPYRLLRHPIYTAILGLSVGTALVDGETHALVGLAMNVLAYWRKIRMEEAKLREAFGPDYDDYSRATWRLVPGIF